MKLIAGTVLTVLGVLAILLGLLFLLASPGQAHRLLVGIVGLALGAVLSGLGLLLIRQGILEHPERIRADILSEARRRSGEVSRADLMAALGPRARLAEAQLQELLTRGRCARQLKEGAEYFVFADLQPRLTIRRCEYCESEVALEADATSCPSCGGSIRTDVERLSLSEGDPYSMD